MSTPTTATYAVAGMTCGHCVSAVTEELRKLAGVRDVQVELVPSGRSSVRVSSDSALPVEQVREAIDEAGYQLDGSDS